MLLATIKDFYAKHIGRAGIYLGVYDLYMIAEAWNKEVALIYFDKDVVDAPTKRSLQQSVWRLTGGLLGSLDHAAPGPNDREAFTLVAVRADYVQDEINTINHFMPAWTESQLQDHWQPLCDILFQKVEKRIASTKGKLQALEVQSDSEGDQPDEHIEALKCSLEANLRMLERKQHFQRVMFGAGLCPLEVPGDGDCLLSSLTSLQAGPVVRASLLSKDRVNALRRETCHCNSEMV